MRWYWGVTCRAWCHRDKKLCSTYTFRNVSEYNNSSTSWQGFIYDSVFGLLNWSLDSKFKVKQYACTNGEHPRDVGGLRFCLLLNWCANRSSEQKAHRAGCQKENRWNQVCLGFHSGKECRTLFGQKADENRDEFLNCEHTGPTDIPPKSRDQSSSVTCTYTDVDSDADRKF